MSLATGHSIFWPAMINYFEASQPTLESIAVAWSFPPHGWFKCNTDGSSRGNPGRSSWGLGVCIQMMFVTLL
ncbi:hypothetical protein RND71_039774 [Anisodus tanguticus]|uniref:Uncharacterized protein n=1 Tax=Anisodus tanguticus TaxID=243964 RepID=A0AAE1UQY7_9SOLA|nr:hypothetical protein RND71_039774 [Anisodus tanguticus]